jgi:hypothetical protein
MGVVERQLARREVLAAILAVVFVAGEDVTSAAATVVVDLRKLIQSLLLPLVNPGRMNAVLGWSEKAGVLHIRKGETHSRDKRLKAIDIL